MTSRGIDHFDERDGLAGDDAAATAFLMDGDGSLWLGSTGGVTHILATHYDGPLAPPRTSFLDGKLGDQPIVARDLNAALEVPHDRNALTLMFASSSMLDAKRIEYQMRLSPIEADWHTTYQREARYPALLPAHYRFEVRARIGVGSWGPATVLEFSVLPAWWQTRWFLALTTLASIMASVAAIAWWLRRRTRQLDAQSDASFRAVLDLIPDLISVQRDRQLIYLNLAQRRFLGLERTGDRWDHVSLIDRVHPEDRERAEIFRARVRKLDANLVSEVVEMRMRGADGSWRVCEVSGIVVERNGGPVMVVSGRDITERQRMRAQLQAQLVEASRLAGRSDVATAVLHNVGNVLNSVNVSVTLVNDIIANSKTNNLAKIAELIAEHRDDFARFVREDRRGQKLPEYLAQLSTAVERDKAMVVTELQSLLRNIGHINAIVSSQQSHVKPGGAVETFEVHELLDDALKLSAGSGDGNAVEIIREVDALPSLQLDRHKALQILTNMLVNAHDAVMARKAGDRRIVVCARRGAEGKLEVEVEDNGCGIDPKNLDQIFQLGFTTKADGHGLGLHFSACAARELNGNLTARSAGVGAGASFLLVLPLVAA
jgi:PAS domain S-box-containing protein